MRTLEVKHPKLIKGIEEIDNLITKLTKDSEKAQKILDVFNKEREEIGQKIDKIKLDRDKIVEDWQKELGEFEIITNLKKEKGKYIAEIVDEFEEWKEVRKENEI